MIHALIGSLVRRDGRTEVYHRTWIWLAGISGEAPLERLRFCSLDYFTGFH
jgi:hypothetical protein